MEEPVFSTAGKEFARLCEQFISGEIKTPVFVERFEALRHQYAPCEQVDQWQITDWEDAELVDPIMREIFNYDPKEWLWKFDGGIGEAALFELTKRVYEYYQRLLHEHEGSQYC